eukprot:Gregarina_sp_Poly_1__6767@NODE_364_length_9189_cov_605_028174_g300_i0_p3_GENE_NODE_364_length_9189_cov_605_028174_g300_i0NODE_364_length_9189_cov_605_028174_g300_i0_p3_ORF_typecomplete_len412_score51_45Integrin_beta/PF00362_18/2_3e10VWA/PF00092_28/0_078_NODE_364_length_9189_cov_605_028174_g300_i015992834
MKLCTLVVSAGATAATVAKHTPLFNSIQQVYGAHDYSKKVLSRDALRANKLFRSGVLSNPEMIEVRRPHHCVFPMNLHLLIDTTSSMNGGPEQAVLDSFPAIAEYLSIHPGSTLSISYFRDKPVDGLGSAGDYCLKAGPVLVDADAVEESYEKEESIGGGDWLNNHLGAIIEILESPNSIPWLVNESATPVILMITNTGPHFAQDGGEESWPELSAYTFYDESEGERICQNHYYPSPAAVKRSLTNSNAYIATVIMDADARDRWAYDTFNWLNTYFQQPTDLLAESVAAAETLEKQIKRVLDGVSRAVCGDQTNLSKKAPRAALLKSAGRSIVSRSSEGTETGECEQPDAEICTKCIKSFGCCNANEKRGPEILIALEQRPRSLNIKAAMPETGSPFVLSLESEGEEIESS